MRSHCALYVDAGYLLAAIATRLTGTSLRSGIEPNHEALVRQLCEHAETKSGLPLLRVHWYDSARHGRPDPQQEQIGLLPRVKVRLGRIGYEGEQKGVDLRIGLDMVAHARNGAVDVMYLVSGDDDLTEAVEEAQAHGVQVTVLAVPTRHGGPHGVSKHLQRAADGLDLLAETLDDTVASTAASIAATIAAAPVTEEEPVEAKPPVPSPAMFAQRTLTAPKHAAGPPVPIKKPADIVYSSSTGGMHIVAHEYQHSPAEYAEIIDAVVERVLTSWQATASAEQRQSLTAARPSIPREIDRALLHDASDALGMYDLNDSVRYQLRTRFWVVADKLA